MAHERRAHLVPEVLERLGLDGDAVAWDTDNNRWHTGRRAWEMHDPSATHHLVLQDDALVALDLIAGLERAIGHIPTYRAADGTVTGGPAETILSPYTGTRRPLSGFVEDSVARARLTGSTWLLMRALMWGVGIVAPTDTIGDMLQWCDRQQYPNYDRRVGRFYYLCLCWPVWYTIPSLVDHRTEDEAPSLCGHGPGRVAHQFAGLDASALDVEWSDHYVVMPGMAQLDEYRRQRDTAGRWPSHG